MSSSLNKGKKGILRRTFRRLGKISGIIPRNKKTNNLSQTRPSQTTPSQTKPSQTTQQHYTTNAKLETMFKNTPTIPEEKPLILPEEKPLILPEVPKTDPNTSNKPYQMTGEEHNKLWLSIQNLQLNQQEKRDAQNALKGLNSHLFNKKGGKTKKTKQKKNVHTSVKFILY
jgi:hypothetical protein